jgi:prepilin-type N-terminal cleavage/methylation domain-containing protein
MRRATERGFTLLEVMMALLILALALGAITYANSAATSHVARITRMTTAAFLMEGIVNDVHAYYTRKGFPTNSLEDKQCELPRDFADTYSCSYDLKAMNMTPEQISEMANGAMQKLMGGGAEGSGGAAGSAASGIGGKVGNAGVGGLGALMGASGAAGAGAVAGAVASSGLDMSKFQILAPLFGPAGPELMLLCNINISQVMMGATALMSFMPRIIDEVAKRTRQLTVRLNWRDGPRGQREFRVQTFVVSLPEAELAQMRDAERQRDVQEAIQSSAPGGGATGTTGTTGNTGTTKATTPAKTTPSTGTTK